MYNIVYNIQKYNYFGKLVCIFNVSIAVFNSLKYIET